VDGNKFASSCFRFHFSCETYQTRCFSENSFWYTSTEKVEIQFYFISDIERMKFSGIELKILQSSPKDSDVENQILVVCYSLSGRGFGA
jgi:hypothetical protein